MTGRSRFRFRFRGVMSLVKSIASQFFDILQKEEAASNTNVFYDPADLTSLRVGRDGSGGQPVVGDPVGIMLDTSQFGGKTAEDYLAEATELVNNPGNPFSATTGWSIGLGAGAISVSGGLLVYSASDPSRVVTSMATVVGSWYFLDWTGFATDGTNFVRVTISSDGSVAGEIVAFTGGDLKGYFQATATTTYVAFCAATGGVNDITGLSAKAIPGHHAIAPSDSARPVLFDDPDLTAAALTDKGQRCLLYTSRSPRDRTRSRMPSSA